MTKQPKQPKPPRVSLRSRLGSLRTWGFRRWILVAVSGVSILIIGVIAYGTVVILLSTQGQVAQTTTQTATDSIPDYTQVLDTAASSPEAAQKQLDEALTAQETDQAKASVYAMKGSLAGSLNGGSDYKTALEYAQKADELDPTASTAASVGSYYAKLGQYSEAVAWYETAQERMGDYEALTALERADYDFYGAMAEEARANE